MEWLYYFIVCALIVALVLLCIDFDYRKNRKCIIPIIALTVFGYLFTWQLRPLSFGEIVDIPNAVPSSYIIHLIDYDNGSYVEYCIDSQSLGNEYAKKEIWHDIRSYFTTTKYRYDMQYLLPWNKVNLDNTSTADKLTISVISNEGTKVYQRTFIFESCDVGILDESTMKYRFYHILENECIYKIDDYIREACALPF